MWEWRRRALPKDERYERYSHNQNIQQVEPGSTKGSRMKNESIRDEFQADFNRKDGGEKVVKVI